MKFFRDTKNESKAVDGGFNGRDISADRASVHRVRRIQPQENLVDNFPQEKRTIAPDFVLNNLSGRQVDLNTYKGSVVLLGFWTTG